MLTSFNLQKLLEELKRSPESFHLDESLFIHSDIKNLYNILNSKLLKDRESKVLTHPKYFALCAHKTRKDLLCVAATRYDFEKQQTMIFVFFLLWSGVSHDRDDRSRYSIVTPPKEYFVGRSSKNIDDVPAAKFLQEKKQIPKEPPEYIEPHDILRILHTLSHYFSAVKKITPPFSFFTEYSSNPTALIDCLLFPSQTPKTSIALLKEYLYKTQNYFDLDTDESCSPKNLIGVIADRPPILEEFKQIFEKYFNGAMPSFPLLSHSQKQPLCIKFHPPQAPDQNIVVCLVNTSQDADTYIDLLKNHRISTFLWRSEHYKGILMCGYISDASDQTVKGLKLRPRYDEDQNIIILEPEIKVRNSDGSWKKITRSFCGTDSTFTSALGVFFSKWPLCWKGKDLCNPLPAVENPELFSDDKKEAAADHITTAQQSKHEKTEAHKTPSLSF